MSSGRCGLHQLANSCDPAAGRHANASGQPQWIGSVYTINSRETMRSAAWLQETAAAAAAAADQTVDADHEIGLQLLPKLPGSFVAHLLHSTYRKGASAGHACFD